MPQRICDGISWLAAAERPLPVDAPAYRGRTAGAGTRRRILIVDDNRDSADSMAILLAMQGYEVRQAYHGREALAVRPTFSR